LKELEENPENELYLFHNMMNTCYEIRWWIRSNDKYGSSRM